ncbi:MAG: phage head closure protein [Rhizobiales bacterium]|nr:phage head closure protein [Hyphomicrobiales bacterium]
MSDPGRLRHRLVLEAPVEADDGAGGVVRSYENIATVWAAIAPVTLSEQVAAEALGARLTHRIVIRTGFDVTTRHRFKLGNRMFRIVAIRDPDESGRFREIHAEERSN